MAAPNMNSLLSARRPSAFLVLAPTASSNYPASPTSLTPTSPSVSGAKEPVSPTQELASPVTKPVENEMEVTAKQRRSSSVSSNTSAQFKFLKLGPVHFGKGDGATDFAEME
ncbi:uncharacterized protein LTHEOB_9803 [Neofusicoccum parvum]|uniref:Uncharacterized protein n=2 Tax=Neofusicoccum parvum TaxID=310453 RepID=R1EKJ6_BOTPV|nr:hypothetical protein UCRNP2_5198 [Neofusicoccum parvum UCRNP2]GME23194.1 uncharacterized protein LTHEOB_9803 [Neofusicoccum parvum]GME37238.1 uncharacterized protein LTHEOB_9803 [Neofusicoccum parvum]